MVYKIFLPYVWLRKKKKETIWGKENRKKEKIKKKVKKNIYLKSISYFICYFKFILLIFPLLYKD